MNYEAIARVCHMVNNAYCDAIKDKTQPSWKEVNEQLKLSVIAGVKFLEANPDASPSEQHDAWMQNKLADGWVYGETKDEKQKTHPCLVPYEQLPLEQRVKDYLFQAVVRALLPLLSPEKSSEELSEANKLVGKNPSDSETVTKLKAAYAAAIGLVLDNLDEAEQSDTKQRMHLIAVEQSLTAQMWAVKAVTYPH